MVRQYSNKPVKRGSAKMSDIRKFLQKAESKRDFEKKSRNMSIECNFLYCIQFLRTSACVCRTSENCKCNIEIFLSPAYI